jgi:hypothetical protein
MQLFITIYGIVVLLAAFGVDPARKAFKIRDRMPRQWPAPFLLRGKEK